MSGDREQLWIAMSDLWLDTELSESRLAQIADEVRASGLARDELEDVFACELAPFLGASHSSVAGEWAGFDPEWVCAEARVRRGRGGVLRRLLARLRGGTFAARPAWVRVKELAFRGRADGRDDRARLDRL